MGFTIEAKKYGAYVIKCEMGVRSFLFEGTGRALLVDTSAEEGLFEFCKTLTSLPILVITTHADGDHVASDKEFAEHFIHPSECDFYESKRPLPENSKAVWEGDVIDLGTYKFEVIHTPGHTPGSIMLLERDKRFLIGGDSIQSGGPIYMFNPGRNFKAYISSMEKLEGYIPLIDTVLASHHDLEVDPMSITYCLDAAKAYLEGKLLSKEAPGKPEDVKIFYDDKASFFAR